MLLVDLLMVLNQLMTNHAEYSAPLSEKYKKARAYQLELIEPALLGHNTLVTAPTGAGKTVAACTLLERLREHPVRVRTLFIVPTVPLVEQQTRVCAEQLAHVMPIGTLYADDMGLRAGSANDTQSRTAKILSLGVTILTAQLAVNQFQHAPHDPLFWSDIDVLVLDECHHADRDHPYHVLMRHYDEYKQRGAHRYDVLTND